MGIQNIKIENFTVFENLNIDFAAGINVFIGENGTGKTHLLKLSYGMIQESVAASKNNVFPIKSRCDIKDYFKVPLSQLAYIKDNVRDVVKISCEGNEFDLRLVKKRGLIANHSSNIDSTIQVLSKFNLQPVFIPAKDILTHSKGFMSLYDKFEMPFDKSYYDIISISLLPKLKEVPEIGKLIIPKLENIIGGKVIVENDTFFIEKNDKSKIEFSVEAEGIKKIAILWQLIMNESISKDTILFWDEPEANINPSLVPDMVEILLELSRNGVQVFLSTHDYIFAKYIEVLKNETDEVAFHSLYKADEGIKAKRSNNFRDLKQNAIVSSFDKLLDKVFDLNMGE